jgi:hypothetical protein
MLDELALVRDMHDETGSWTRVDEEIRWSDRKRRDFLNTPGGAKALSRGTRQAIARAARRLLPFPLPEHLTALRAKLADLKARPSSSELEEFLSITHGLLVDARPTTLFTQAAYGYVLGLVLMSMALHHKNQNGWFGGRAKWREYLQGAEQVFDRCGRAIDEGLNDAPKEEQKVLARLRPFLLINWIATVVEQAKAGYHRSIDEALTLLRDKDALAELRRFLNTYPHLWQAAWNGLDLASMFEDDEMACWFYNRLKVIDRGFQSFDYAPGEVQSISVEMPYFSARFREQLHKPIPPKKRRSKKARR